METPLSAIHNLTVGTGCGCSATGARNQRGATGPIGPFRYVPRVSVLLSYARMSTAEQNADLQTDELTSAGCYAVFVDRASGVLDRRLSADVLMLKSASRGPRTHAQDQTARTRNFEFSRA